MKFDEIMYITNKIINNEFNHVENENLEGMNDLENYNKIAEEANEIYIKLSELLPKEYKYLIDKLESRENDRLSIEIRHYFKKGVAAGTANLNFIKDITGGIKFY
ncbi:hypothetical protein [Clostridium saccharobutylicum]|uniref:Uncharacterized protein n=1 Tax=Clostridium saccharobutylicum TaxID=169679 RepID=A0A1S8NJS6_CLOSA|nr:hypothetical protein [Clostridium saccharobutylicum]OOM16754.1 hypothetical protein CLOSAC_10480 [Clostridium saccharobutylicum]